jgi:nucleolar protein 12
MLQLAAYVVMTTEEAAQQALGLNGHLFGEKHLRVDGAAGSKYDHKRTLFVGNLRFDATEEQVGDGVADPVLSLTSL